jgi:hypothetical protein
MNQDTLTSAAAGAALTSPGWLHMLQDWSTVAGALLPILGAVWLIVQIATKIIETRRRRRDE